MPSASFIFDIIINLSHKHHLHSPLLKLERSLLKLERSSSTAWPRCCTTLVPELLVLVLDGIRKDNVPGLHHHQEVVGLHDAEQPVRVLLRVDNYEVDEDDRVEGMAHQDV